jgi:hypothetical protein
MKKLNKNNDEDYGLQVKMLDTSGYRITEPKEICHSTLAVTHVTQNKDSRCATKAAEIIR